MPQIAKTIFTTSDFSPTEKYDAFVDNIDAVFAVDRLKGSIKSFSADITSYLIDEVMLVRCDTKGQEFTRDSYKIAKDGIDHYFFQLFRKGGTNSLLSDGLGNEDHIIVIDASRPWKADNQDFDVITLVLPRRKIEAMLCSPEAHHGRSIPLSDPLGRMIADYILALYDNIDHLNCTEANSLLSPMIDLLAFALNSFHSKGFSPQLYDKELLSEKTTKEIIKRFIDLNLHLNYLTIEYISLSLKKSENEVFHYFKWDGGIDNFIFNRRMEIAYKKVSQSSSPLDHIAHSLGFKNERVFNRAFKKYFGKVPREARELAFTHTLKKQSLRNEHQWGRWMRNLAMA